MNTDVNANEKHPDAGFERPTGRCHFAVDNVPVYNAAAAEMIWQQFERGESATIRP
jgi:hypothetical protein